MSNNYVSNTSQIPFKTLAVTLAVLVSLGFVGVFLFISSHGNRETNGARNRSIYHHPYLRKTLCCSATIVKKGAQSIEIPK
jgi:cell division protein FtsX